MIRPSHIVMKKPGFGALAALILTLSLVFLQEGFTYYLSFQVLALATVAFLILSTFPALRKNVHFFLTFFVFSFFVAITAVVSPAVIAANSSNIMVTVIGILGYAVMIGCLPNLRIKRTDLILRVCKSVSSATIFVLAGLIIVSESGLVPFLTREAMTNQNSRLIDNFTDVDALSADAALRLLTKESERIDLFYGEPSFLAIVLFTCLGCFMLSSKLLSDTGKGGKGTTLKRKLVSRETTIFVGVICLLYIQSFSSIIYGLIVLYFVFIKRKVGRTNLVTSILFVAVIAAAFVAFSYEYFLFRVTQADSLSFAQRFGFILDVGIKDLFLGIKDATILPYGGIHNGLFYIIAIAGFGGILYLVSLLYSVYSLSLPIKSCFFWVLLVLAIIMQNGGIFSPNKVVLISLVLLPLACARSIYSRGIPAVIDHGKAKLQDPPGTHGCEQEQFLSSDHKAAQFE